MENYKELKSVKKTWLTAKINLKNDIKSKFSIIRERFKGKSYKEEEAIIKIYWKRLESEMLK